MKKNVIRCVLMCLFPLTGFSEVQTEAAGNAATVHHVERDNDERLAWWREAKFGLFVHWGVYVVLAGEYQGETVPGIGEWIQYKKQIPKQEYLKDYAGKFNPTEFNANAFVRMARDAGMKFIVITAKHHDGFAMYDSAVSAYNMVDATPYGKDPLKALAKACKKYDIRLGFYYSHRIDWEHPDAICDRYNDWDYNPTNAVFDRYWKEKSMPQVKELLSQYGDVSLLWVDMARGLDIKYAREMAEMARSLQPDILINSRIMDEGYEGPGMELWDYETSSDNYIHPQLDMKDWEAIVTTTDSWGHKKVDTNFRSAKQIVQVLVSVVSKGGNLLLNVGPDATGVVDPAIQQHLKNVGVWLDHYGETVYSAKGTPFSRTHDWGVITRKPGILYLNVFEWPAGGFIDLSGLQNKVKSVYALTEEGKLPLSYKQKVIKNTSVHHLNVMLPDRPVSVLNTVIAVEHEGDLEIDQSMVQDARCITRLDFFNAERDDEAKKLAWDFNVLRPGRYKVKLISSESQHHENPEWVGGGQSATLQVNGKATEFVLKQDGVLKNFNQIPWNYVISRIGDVEFEKPGDYTLELSGLDLAYEKYRTKGLALNYVELVPIEQP
ncbi:alpha-L-fucosidase [Pontiella sulfatireligans]|uniref:alpha-L-fucosidase n=1 Tax=Pontiella sulfatireligans TaxID=2750658 RepID=A0A6C2UDA2_9BACT|nr:alpha-L-fucosidase [Pontiella sulfatireligans]VGO18168.1 hypothetical protein SCARR_00219 [Pontiella sulfatireligans]